MLTVERDWCLNSLRNLFSPKPSICDDKDPVVPTGVEQFSADICNQIRLPDTGGKLDQRSIRVAAREKVLDCCRYLLLQRAQTCGVRGGSSFSPERSPTGSLSSSPDTVAAYGRSLPSVQGTCQRLRAFRCARVTVFTTPGGISSIDTVRLRCTRSRKQATLKSFLRACTSGRRCAAWRDLPGARPTRSALMQRSVSGDARSRRTTADKERTRFSVQ